MYITLGHDVKVIFRESDSKNSLNVLPKNQIKIPNKDFVALGILPLFYFSKNYDSGRKSTVMIVV